MRRSAWSSLVAVVIAGAVALSACGSGSSAPTTSTTDPGGGGSHAKASFAAYSACLKAHGVKLPTFNGGPPNGSFPAERELPHQREHTSRRGWPRPFQLSCVPQGGRRVRELAPDGLREQARWSQFLECRLCCLPQLLEAPRSDASHSADQLQLDAADHLQLHESEGQEGARRLRWSPAEIHPPIEREHDDDDFELIVGAAPVSRSFPMSKGRDSS